MDALTAVRMDAMIELGTVDPDDKTAVLRLQAVVAVTTDIKSMLESKIYKTGVHDGGYDLNP